MRQTCNQAASDLGDVSVALFVTIRISETDSNLVRQDKGSNNGRHAFADVLYLNKGRNKLVGAVGPDFERGPRTSSNVPW